jgi:hypothetical protein
VLLTVRHREASPIGLPFLFRFGEKYNAIDTPCDPQVIELHLEKIETLMDLIIRVSILARFLRKVFLPRAPSA